MRFSTTFITSVLLALTTSSASAAQIGTSPNALRQTAQTVNNAANAIQHDAQTANNAVNNLLKVFHGGSASAVQQQLGKAEAGVRQAIQAYAAIVSTLNRAAQ